MKRFISGCAFFLFSSQAFALSVAPLLNVGMEFGGQKLVDVTYSDGSKSDIEAGRGFLLAGGALFYLNDPAPHTVEIQTSFGVKYTTVKEATNASIDFLRWPVEALVFYRNSEKKFRLGAGITHQINNKLEGSEDASGLSMDFENATGTVIAGEYIFGSEENMSVGIRSTTIKYQPKAVSGSVNANSLGFTFTFLFSGQKNPEQKAPAVTSL